MTMQEMLRERLAAAIKEYYGIEQSHFTVEVPPRTELGDLAFPVAFELAKQLKAATGQKQNPREIASRLAESLRDIDGIARVDIAGAGYLNIYFDRAAYLLKSYREDNSIESAIGGKLI